MQHRPSPLLADRYPLEAGVFSLDAVERFPEGIFRIPLPNALLKAMSGLSSSALRAALGLYHRSHHFDPETSWWVQTERGLLRAEIERASGLSEQGTRDGLADLAERGWVQVDRSGRSYRYRWARRTLRPDEGGYTYVPTALLDALGARRGRRGPRTHRLDDGAAHHPHGPALDVGLHAPRPHRRRTPRPRARPLEGPLHPRPRPVRRVLQERREARREGLAGPLDRARAARPRSLPVPILAGSGAVWSPKDAFGHGNNERRNGLFFGGRLQRDPPDSPSDPPPLIKSSPQRDTSLAQHTARPKRETRRPSTRRSSRNRRAVQPSEPRKQRRRPPNVPSASFDLGAPLDVEALPEEQRRWARTLQNTGVSSYRIREILGRYSLARIEANFELYRQRASETPIRNPGGYLAQAITQGWALPGDDVGAGSGAASLPSLNERDMVSAARRDAYIAAGIPAGAFYRCPAASDGLPRFMYLPNGPGRRR